MLTGQRAGPIVGWRGRRPLLFFPSSPSPFSPLSPPPLPRPRQGRFFSIPLCYPERTPWTSVAVGLSGAGWRDVDGPPPG